MMFLQIVPNLFSQLCPGAMKDYSNDQGRRPQKASNLLVVKSFVIPQDEHLTCCLPQARHRLPNQRL
jgi:hypothetical protein